MSVRRRPSATALPWTLRARATGRELHRRAVAAGCRTQAGAARQIRRELELLAWHLTTPALGGVVEHELRVSSQNGEDGIIGHLLDRVGGTNRFAVEIGAADGIENCTRHLLGDPGWTGLWVEGDADRAAAARATAPHGVRVLSAMVTAEGARSMFDQNGVPEDLDLLVIDVDGDDLRIFWALTQRYRPRVVVLEHNGSFPPPQRWIAPPRAAGAWDGSRAFGASLSALHDVARRRGYVLVGCDSSGTNAFWVRGDLSGRVPELVGDPAHHYRPPRYVAGWLGHPPLPPDPTPMPTLTEHDTAAIEVVGLEVVGRAEPGRPTFALATIENRSTAPLTSAGPHAVHAALRWWSEGAPLVGEPRRSRLLRPVPPGGRASIGLETIAPAAPGHHVLEATLVQEGIRWWPGSAGARVDLELMDR